MIYVYDRKKNLIGSYDIIKQAADATGITPFQITEALQGKVRLLSGLVFSPQELVKFRKKRHEVQVSVQGQ